MNKYRITYTYTTTKIGGPETIQHHEVVEADSFDTAYAVLRFYDEVSDEIRAYKNWDSVVLIEKGKDEEDEEDDTYGGGQ